MPGLFGPLERGASRLAVWIHARAGVVLPPRIFIPVCVACFIAFLWGILYHYMRLGRRI